MPTYDYVCHDCGHRFGIRLSISAYSEGVTPTCARCGSHRAERSFGAVNVLTGSRHGGGTASPSVGCGPTGFG